MGMLKDQQIEAEDNWNAYARANDIRCNWCGSPLGYNERELISEHTCGHCKYVLEKDD